MGTPGANLISIAVQILGALLFAFTFSFLWRRSGILYFGLWAIAWAVEAPALVFQALYPGRLPTLWLSSYAVSEFGFVVLLLAAARCGVSGSRHNWRAPLKILLASPLVLALALLLRTHGRPDGYRALHAGVLYGVYLYNFATVRVKGGIGAKFFRLSLLFLAGYFQIHAILFLYCYLAAMTLMPGYIEFSRLWELPLHVLLAFSAMALWIESQQTRLDEVGNELDRVRRENNLELDHLTGLLNQSALAKRMEETPEFAGVVSVCDMDNFKEVNDRYGHLVGDEILVNIGHLLRSSIRQQDEAFRWGGDEFVILFRNQNQKVARSRMQEIEARLRGFQVRGHGALAISFSWGTAEASGRSLRETLDLADRDMYAFKRERKGG